MKHDTDLSIQERVSAPDDVLDVTPTRPLARVTTALLRGAVQAASLGAIRLGGADASTLGRPGWLPKMSMYRASLILLVVVPSLISWVYLAFIASDQYVAEARFAVRSAQPESGTGASSLSLSSLTSGSVSLAGQDGYVVATYIRSHAIIEDLSKTLDIRAIFTRPEADVWARLEKHASAEALLHYWQGMVGAYVDGPSGIVTVSVRAFRPEDAVVLASSITQVSEALVNRISARAREDSMRRAEDEVRDSEAKVQASLSDMRDFRDKQGYIDPISAATSTATLLSQVLAQQLQVENDLFVANSTMSPDAPQLKSLKTNLAGLNVQIAQLKGELTGHSDEQQTVAASLAKFEELELHRIFAEKLYTLSQDGLERARKKAEQQNIYISVFVPPALPEDPRYPERLSLSLIIPVGLLIIWGICALTAAAIDDHRN